MGHKKNTNQFIEESNEIHKYKYDYSKSNYVNIDTKVCIICHEKDENGNEHGEFWQTPYHHIHRKQGCPICGNQFCDTNLFIEKARKIHGNKYDYSKVIYINNRTKVCIICPIHGEFWIEPHNHISKKAQGCPKCKNKIIGDKLRKTLDVFIAESKSIFGDTLCYDKVNYINNKTKIILHCKIHDIDFEVAPDNHLKRHVSCPECAKLKKSILEQKINSFCEKNNIKYHTPYKFTWLKNKYPLHVDFYLPDFNVAIECQGIQHFKPIDFGGYGDAAARQQFTITQENDKIKRKLCQEHNIKLLYYSNLHIDYPYHVYEDLDELLKEIKRENSEQENAINKLFN